MDTAQTEKLKALALAATPGPWFESDWGEDDGDNKTTIEAREPEALHQGQSSMWPGGVRCIGIAETEMGARPIEDAAFIAAANPATVLDLIADNERLRADVETRDALLRALNAVAIERGDKYGACDCIDNKGNPYPSQHLADILSVSAPVAGAKEKA